jgi:hypothetical protein
MLGMAERLRSISTILEWHGVPPVRNRSSLPKRSRARFPWLLLWLLRLAKRRVHPRTHADPHARIVHLPRSLEHAVGGASAWPRRASDDALFAVREGNGGRASLAVRHAFLCPAADPLRDGPVWAASPCPSRRCRLRRSVGSALSECVAAQKAWCGRWKNCLIAIPLCTPGAPPTCSSLSNESVNVSCVYWIEASQSLLDLRIR